MFFGTSIAIAFWDGFGRPKCSISHFFDVFSMQNLECNLEGQKIEKKRSKIFSLWFWRYVRAWGEDFRMGGRQLGMNPWPATLAMLLRNAFWKLWSSVWHARLSLREAADVLRTYRRATRWFWKAESECQQGFFAAIRAPCLTKPWQLCKKHVR